MNRTEWVSIQPTWRSLERSMQMVPLRMGCEDLVGVFQGEQIKGMGSQGEKTKQARARLCELQEKMLVSNHQMTAFVE